MPNPFHLRDPASTMHRSTLALMAFWVVVGGLLYAGFSWWHTRQRAALQPYYIEASGELIIPRSPDGHFYVPGEINHQPVRFLVDTGASTVAVTQALAHLAQLPPGTPITLQTAGGTRDGRIVHGVSVKIGPLIRNDVSITVGLFGATDNALLGQSFLRHFRVEISGNRMVLSTHANSQND